MIIYKTTNLINNKIYIGRSVNNHKHYIGSGKNIDAAVKKYGKHNFKKEIIDTALTYEELRKKETFWIIFYNSTDSKIGYNIIRDDLFPSNEYKISDEGRDKLRNSRLGKKMSQQSKDKISKAKKGVKVHSEESKLRISIGAMRVCSEETKRKISAGNKGKVRTIENRNKISQAIKNKHK